VPFEARSFSTNNFSNNISSLRKKLLHEIYTTMKSEKVIDSDKIIESDFENIKDDTNYNNNFAKLIVSYFDHEELFYLPEGTRQADVVSILNLKLAKNKTWVWKSELVKAQTAYLIEANANEILKNEIEFTVEEQENVTVIYPFQKIQIHLQVLQATPNFKIEERSIQFAACKGDDECRCTYSRTIPSGSYTSYNLISKDSLNTQITMNQTNTSLKFNPTIDGLEAELLSDFNMKDLNIFKIELPQAEPTQFYSKARTCTGGVHNEIFNLQNLFQYKINYKVYGSKYTLDTFGTIPAQI
jgi:hypothetical protein